jgi:hypothetical protein
MQKKQHHFNSRVIANVSVLFLFFLGVAVWVTTSAKLQDKERSNSPISFSTETFPVFTKAASLEILNSEFQNGRIIIRIRNTSQKSANGFYLTGHDMAWQYELVYSEVQDNVPPFAEYEIAFTSDKSKLADGITINAVLFDDGTGDGEPKFINVMKDKRYGEKLELTHGKRLLDEYAVMNHSITSDDIDELKKKFATECSKDVASEHSENVRLGIDSGRQRFLRVVEGFNKGDPNNNFSDIGPLIKSASSRLQKFITKL